MNKTLVRVLFLAFLMSIAGGAFGVAQDPVVLLWVVVEKDEVTNWIENDSPIVADLIKTVFEQRAINCLLPLLDLTDTTAVSEQDVVTQQIAVLERGSVRYHPNVIVLGQLKDKGAWEGRWTILREGQSTIFEVQGQDLTTLLNETAERMVKLLQVESKAIANTTPLFLSVSGITTAEQYAKVLESLHRLPTVTAVEVSEVLPEKTIYELKTTLDREGLIHALSDNRGLVKNPDNVSNVLSYTLSGDW